MSYGFPDRVCPKCFAMNGLNALAGNCASCQAWLILTAKERAVAQKRYEAGEVTSNGTPVKK